MMPQQSPVDVRVVSSSPRQHGGPFGRPPQATVPSQNREHLAREVVRLETENTLLIEEIQRLRDENQDLRDSANIWIRLYERQLGRANEALKTGTDR
jgi:hypothetical protein